jgi:uncharacterized protein YndB with AHSA1/START domain
MTDKPKFVYVVFVAAPQDKVWHALTDAKATASYLSGFHVETDLKAGGDSRFQKGEQVLNRGVVLACEPPRKLQVTWKPEMGEFANEKPSRVTFEVEAMGANQSKLTIVHDDFEAGSKAAGYVGEGWMRVASSLKSFVETGKGMDLLGAIEGAGA